MLKNDINIPLLVTIGAVSSILLVVVLIGVHAWYLYEVQGETQLKWAGLTNKQVYELKQQQRSDLAGPPRWADKEKGVVKIPIDEAIKVVAQNGGKLPK